MRTLLPALLLALLPALSGCPGRPGDNAAGDGAPPPAAVASTADEAAAASGAAASAETATQSQSAAGLELLGMRLGMSIDDFMALYPPTSEYVANLRRMNTNDVAICAVRPKDGGPELRDATFANAVLIHLVVTDKLDGARYTALTDELKRKYGPPADDPPPFAAGHEFFKSFASDKPSFLGVMFWSDPAAGTLLSATMWPAKDTMNFVLFNPTLYDSLHKRQMKTELPPDATLPPGAK